MAIKINGTNTAAAPGITGPDTDTGLVYGTNQIDFSTGGTSRATIDSAGALNIGQTTAGFQSKLTVGAGTSDEAITVLTGTGNGGALYFADGTSNDDSRYRGWVQYQHGSDYMTFGTVATERMRIQSSGRVLINTTSNWIADSKFEVHSTTSNVGGFYNNSTLNNYPLLVRNNRCDGGTTGTMIIFLKSGGSEIGSIRANGSSTSYNTSSDYRLKENITSISDGITRLKTLKPSRFNFKSNTGTIVDGFLAHEVTAVPEAITGTKDEVATEDKTNFTKGDPIYQSIDQSKLVPLLTAALQEAIAKIEVLETKVAALEAG